MKGRLKSACAPLLRLDRAILAGFTSILTLRAAERLSGLVVVACLFRMLEKEQVAEYGFIQTVGSIFAIFCIPELQNTISQSVSRGFPGTYRTAVSLALKWSIVGAGLVASFGIWYYLSGNRLLGHGFFIAAALLPVSHALVHWKGVYLGEKDFVRFSVAEGGNAIFKSALIIAALAVFPGSLLAPVFIFYAVPAIQNLWQTLRCYRRIPEHAAVEPGAIAYGLRTNRYLVIGVVADNLDRILIFTLLSPPLLAIFMAAEKFAELLQGVVQDLGAVLAPKFSITERYSRRLDDTLKIISFAIGVLTIVFAIFALPSLVVLVFGASFLEAVPYAQVLVGTVAIRNIASLRFRFIRSKLDSASYRKILVVGSTSKILASLALIPLFGLGGAVASVILHRLVLASIISRIIQTEYLNEAKS